MVFPHQNAKASAAEPDQSFSMVPSGASTNYAVPSSGMYMPLHPSGRSWEINREQVNVIKVIGKGAFSQVAKATAWDIRGNGGHTIVVAKMLKGVINVIIITIIIINTIIFINIIIITIVFIIVIVIL